MDTGGRVLDPRLRTAVDASIGWYEDLCALHGVGSTLADGLWSSLTPPPPLHSDAVTVEPAVTAEQVAGRLEGRGHAGVKDSFSTLDLRGAGMRVLFSATWVHRAPAAGAPGPWVAVRAPEDLAEWTARHDTAEVLLPGLLRRGRFTVLARYEDRCPVAGAVARLGSGAVDVSNVWAAPGHEVGWAGLAAAVGALLPGRPLVGYEQGEELEAALAGGFEPVGELRVWVR